MKTKRYSHILVPLDGSELAELALVDAVSLAKLSEAKLTLLHVVAPVQKVLATDVGYPIYIDQQWESLRTVAQEYLHNACQRLGCDDLKIDLKVVMGPPAETIIEYAYRHPVELIVMATHGRSGLKRWMYGSVAGKVLRGANVPVLLVRAYPDQHQAERLEQDAAVT